MNNDTQIKHYLWWLIKTQGKLPDTYAEFLQQPLSEEICKDIDELVTHIKLTY
jgi:hypothetical protein